MKKKIVEGIETYGDLIRHATGGFLISYKEYGSYQGDYIAILENKGEILVYKGGYGSCSGCDFLQDRSDRITEEDIKEYMKDEGQDFIRFKTSQRPETVEDLKTLLPANTRIDYDDKWEDTEGVNKPWLEHIFEQLNRDQSTNLEYLEWRDKQRE